MGCIYALVAISYNMILNATGVVNFAQGDWVMVGAFISVWLVASMHLSYLAALILLVIFMVVFGIMLERITYKPLHGKGDLAAVIATLGASIALQNLAQIAFGVFPKTMPSVFGNKSVNIFGTDILAQYLLIIGCTFVLFALQYLLFNKTKIGAWLRAVSMDADTAALLGIPVTLMLSVIFAISAIYSGIAGYLLVPVVFASSTMGTNLLLKGFAAVVVGGFGNLQGAIVGAFIVSLTETFAAAFISSVYKDAYAFIVLIIILIAKPEGIFSGKIGEKV